MVQVGVREKNVKWKGRGSVAAKCAFQSGGTRGGVPTIRVRGGRITFRAAAGRSA